MRIFIFCDTLGSGKGGAEKIASDLMNEMDKRGHELFAGYQGPQKPSYDLNQTVQKTPWNKSEISIEDYRNIVKKISPDAFFIFYFNHLLIEYYRIIAETGIPFGIQECTNPDRLRFNNWKTASKKYEVGCWEREIIASGAARIRLVMPGYETSFPSFIRRNIRAFPNPSPERQSIQNHVNRAKQRKTIINIGGFKPNKNFLAFLKAFAPLAEKYEDWDVNVYGNLPNAHVSHHQDVLSFINENNLANRINICGPFDDILAEYQQSDLHVIASHSEGCPTCILEAMACRLPSIGFADCPGTNKLIEHKKNGLLVNADDEVRNLRTALETLMVSDQLRYEYGKKAFLNSKNFRPKMIYDQWEKLFFEIAAYKNKLYLLIEEQMEIDNELALHAQRMRAVLYPSI